MIQYTNITRYDNLDFGSYLRLGGNSFSFLKGERYGQKSEVTMTDKIKIGKMVDAILSDPGQMEMMDSLYPIAKSIAYEIKRVFGSWIERFEKQISFTATMELQGFSLFTSGRLDYLLPGHAVVDLKVTHTKGVDALIRFMKYDDQLWNYAQMAQVKKKYIMIHSVPLNKTFMKDMGVVTPRNEFWESKVLKLGKSSEGIIS